MKKGQITPEGRVGLYTGSFDPFHKGHYHVLEHFSHIFDHIIVARGVNPNKGPKQHGFPEVELRRLGFIVDEYEGLLTDYIRTSKHFYETPTIIKGIRNCNDLEYERTQLRYMQDQISGIRMVFMTPDDSLSHISSSAIRYLLSIGKKEEAKKYLHNFNQTQK